MHSNSIKVIVYILLRRWRLNLWRTETIISIISISCILAGCGRINFELLPVEENQQTDEDDANAQTDIDTGTDEDTGTQNGVDPNMDSETDTSSTTDTGEADTGSGTDSGTDTSVDTSTGTDTGTDSDTDTGTDSDTDTGTEYDAGVDAGEDAGDNGCVLAGVDYEEGQAAAFSGTLLITAVHSGKCAGIDTGSFGWGALLVQQSCDYSLGQLWESLDAGEGWYSLKTPKSGHCIEPNDRDTDEGVEVCQWDCWFPETQQYQAICSGNDQWRIVNRASGLSLNVEDASTADGAHFTGRTDLGQANQRFQIESQTDLFAPIVPTAEQTPPTVWRYWTASEPTDWNQEGFDDSGWSEGPGGFGEGDNRGNIGTTWNTSDIWLRMTFELTSPLPSSASLRIYHDEAAEVYINGVLAFSAVFWISGYLQAELGASALAALHIGTNTIAVHCSNASSPQYIDVGLGTYAWSLD